MKLGCSLLGGFVVLMALGMVLGGAVWPDPGVTPRAPGLKS